eukprot:CAMPEP_0169116646 /NCGR_PEP_ID=MMETSP1015-20121227/30006_1 /TAXON_ID=342587 /ORGANISM="Karlodinium micrum, Strain CCMP2283" /LENGTH=184 /DNA_ID=CAMNT_0009179217 /DNA_START=70 /DNA_END=624 /DNA_ORIENTATION=+
MASSKVPSLRLTRFENWIHEEKKRREDKFPVCIVSKQVIAWICVVRHQRKHGKSPTTDHQHLTLPRFVRDSIASFVGDQSFGTATAVSLRKRAEVVRFENFWAFLAPALQAAADKGLMSYHTHQNIEELPFGEAWIQEPEATQWMRSRLEERGFTVELCKLYTAAYAGYQGCSFFELKMNWSSV